MKTFLRLFRLFETIFSVTLMRVLLKKEDLAWYLL